MLHEASSGEIVGVKTAASSRGTRCQEQGDKKQFSPEGGVTNTGGKPPLKRKKSGHSHTNSHLVKPNLELQQPSYY